MNYDKNSFLAGLAVGRQLKGWGHVEEGGIPDGFCFCPTEADYDGGIYVTCYAGSSLDATQNRQRIRDGETVTLDSGFHTIKYSMKGNVIVAEVNIYVSGIMAWMGFFGGGATAGARTKVKFPQVGRYTATNVVRFLPNWQQKDTSAYFTERYNTTVNVADISNYYSVPAMTGGLNVGTWKFTAFYFLPIFKYNG